MGQAGETVEHVRLCCLVDNRAGGVCEGVGGRINACRGIVSTDDLGGRLIVAEGTIIYVDAIVVGIADGRWFGINFVSKNKAPKRQDTYVIMWVSGWIFVVYGGGQLSQPWRDSVRTRTGIAGGGVKICPDHFLRNEMTMNTEG